MESAFLRMWDVPRSLIFCSSCIVMLLGICRIYLSNPFFISPRAPITTRIVRLSPLHSFNFDFKVSIFWQFFSYFNWSVFFSKNGYINEQAVFFVCSWFQCLVCWLYLIICLHWHIPQDCDVRTISRFCLYSYLLLQLASWIMSPIFANARISGHFSK